MNEGWIKLHKKIADNEILHDSNCLKIFIWLLTKVDTETGKVTIGRFVAARELRMNPSTFYSALDRLEKKHKITTHNSNNKFTEISLLNWSKYQSKEKVTTQSDNNATTTPQHLYKDIRYKNRETVQRLENKLDYLLNIPLEDFKEFLVISCATDEQVKNKGSEFHDYCIAKGKAYKNYKAALRNALRRDYPKISSKREGYMTVDELKAKGLYW